MSNSLEIKLIQAKIDKESKSLFRTRKILDSDKIKCNFSCNDYLSLTNDPKVKSFYQNAFKKYPTGSSGSMLLSGYNTAQAELERNLAIDLNVDACILFSSGYIANLCVVSLLSEFAAHLLIDKSVHASIYDGIKMSGAKYTRFVHNDLPSLKSKIPAMAEFENIALITESIFSMSGQIADLSNMNMLIKDPKFSFIVDEAHAFGVIGDKGLGGVVDAGLTQEDVPLRIIPLGKAAASCGAIVAGKAIWIESLLQMRSAIYTTAHSPAFACGLLDTINYLQTLDARREKLQTLIAYFRSSIKDSGLKWRNSNSHIQQLQLGCPQSADKISKELARLGIACLPVRQPTVSKSETGLRVILNSQHEEEQIDFLFNSLHKSLI